MLSFLAFTPHSPLMLPTIGKDHHKELTKTLGAMEQLKSELTDAKPDVLVVISSHQTSHVQAFSIQIADPFVVDLKEFGDVTTAKTFHPDLELSSLIRVQMREKSISFTSNTSSALEYSVSVPLLLLTEKLSSVRIVPLVYSGQSAKDHVQFGRELKDLFSASPKRIAIIATGDLSHALTSQAPMGYRKEGQRFDDAVKLAMEHLSTSQLLALDPQTIEQSAECAYRPLLILFGLLERLNIRPEILSYEAPFGVGYLVALFRLE